MSAPHTPPPDNAPLDSLLTLAARSFASSDELTVAVLVLVADQLGLRTSFVTENIEDGATQRILAVHNLPGGSDVAAGIVVPLEDTF